MLNRETFYFSTRWFSSLQTMFRQKALGYFTMKVLAQPIVRPFPSLPEVGFQPYNSQWEVSHGVYLIATIAMENSQLADDLPTENGWNLVIYHCEVGSPEGCFCVNLCLFRLFFFTQNQLKDVQRLHRIDKLIYIYINIYVYL